MNKFNGLEILSAIALKPIGIATCDNELQARMSIGKAWIAKNNFTSYAELLNLSKKNKRLQGNHMKNVQLKNVREISSINVGYEDIFGKLFSGKNPMMLYWCPTVMGLFPGIRLTSSIVASALKEKHLNIFSRNFLNLVTMGNSIERSSCLFGFRT